MINKLHRFHGYNSLRMVYQKGRTVRGSAFGVKFVLNKHRQQYRLAVVVSKKVAKSAVERNRIRRRLYEVVRQLDPGISEPYDIVLTVYSDKLFGTKNEQLRREVASVFNGAGITHKLS